MIACSGWNNRGDGMDKLIFVFGSNLAGRHGKGAALYAKENRGAVYGVGEGLTGSCYAIPTKGSDRKLTIRSLDDIERSIKLFLEVARNTKDSLFMVTPIGTGLAGYTKKQIAGIFKSNYIPPNVVFTKEWFE